ncbi:PfkB family carbohydrate kinase [Rubrobacter aplysinae]|uniref:PfkB family carbohydrate kinase n=1 Tax=Rubrobacter aplysinae TaxID=909625 RepID=UPI00069F2201|nr:PfkB family carbohydrate kinase [Rubrobacter aplysinae]
MADVLVVGSINQDFVLRVARRPEPGETITGAGLGLGPRSVVLTLGDSGALLAQSDLIEHAPTPTVPVIDTTAAGDTSVGAPACTLASACDLPQSVRCAARAGALAITRAGARDSLPTAEEVESL